MKVEIRANQAIIEGYVNVVERESRVLPSSRGKFIEKVKAGTFQKSIMKNPNIELRFNHANVLGSTMGGELMLKEDSVGLYAKAIVTNDDVIRKARNKELRGWSFGFVAKTDRWEGSVDGIQRRSLEDIDLQEVSILDKTPAYIATSIETRGEEENYIEFRSVEEDIELTEIEGPVKKEEKEKPESREFETAFFVAEKEIEILKLKGEC